MDSKKTVLINLSYLVELPVEDIYDEFGGINVNINELQKSRNIDINGNSYLLDWISSSELLLETKNLNCGKCSRCGQWTTDKEKADSIEGLCYGATVNGELLCDDCLPHDHRWAF